MSDRPIIKQDAAAYIDNVSKHGIEVDTQWIIDTGRFPVGCCVLDVGSGTGKLAHALATQKDFYRSVRGVELSRELAMHAKTQWQLPNLQFAEGDFLEHHLPPEWNPDTIVMSFYLHHCEDHVTHLRRAAGLLPHGGRLYVFDRIAVDDGSRSEFQRFWESEYRDAHEWNESIPNLCTIAGLIGAAAKADLRYVRHQIAPHDQRPGTKNFPKTLMEFWRQTPGHTFPAVALISPGHQHLTDEIIDTLESEGFSVHSTKQVPYMKDLIHQLYERCPWKECLGDFVVEKCPDAKATAVVLAGDTSTPEMLQRLTRFKKTTRDRWGSISGVERDGMRPMILPFHVAEPYEAEELVQLLEIELKQ
jgi:ubiquinone/menaquinone biosynthesis C-methylase UbiE